MTMPALPGLGTTSWFDWASAVHDAADEVTTGRLTGADLRAALVPWATDWQIDVDGGDLEFRLVGASEWAARIFDESSNFQVQGALIGSGFINYGDPLARIPFDNGVTIDGSALTSANLSDKIGMQNSVLFTGGFSAEAGLGASNPGFIWGANDFILTGTAAGDVDGVTDMQGRLTEVHMRTPGATVNHVSGLVAESAVGTEATGATVTGWLASMIARGPENRATPAAAIANAASLLVESPAAGVATNQYALRVIGGGLSTFDGDVEMSADPSDPGTINAFHGGFKGKTVQVGTPLDLTSGALLNVKTTADGDVAAWIAGRGGQTGDILRLGRDAVIHARFDKRGRFITNQTDVPADADLGNGDLSLYVDSTSGAMKLMIKAKDAGGTVRTGQVALS